MAITPLKNVVTSVLRSLKIRVADRAHAGRPVQQRNEPEPAMIEPKQADVALRFAGQPPRPGEMAIHRRLW